MTCKIPYEVFLAPLLIPIFLVYVPACLLKHYTIDAWNVRPPRARKRERRLTLPFDLETTAKEIGFRARLRERMKKPTTEQQSEFGFFTLPLEIREMIYEEYIGEGKIWIIQPKKGKLHSLRTINSDETPWVGTHVVPLLLACRRTYSEVIHLIYSIPMFTFLDPISLFVFSASIIPQRFHSIRNLHIHLRTSLPNNHGFYDNNNAPNQLLQKSYKIARRAPSRFHNSLPRGNLNEETRKMLWQKMWDIVAAMKGLRKLEFYADIDAFDYSHYTRMRSDEATPRSTMCLRELLLLGMKKGAKIDVHFTREKNARMQGRELPEGMWRLGLEEGQNYEERDKWHGRMSTFEMEAFRVLMQFNGREE